MLGTHGMYVDVGKRWRVCERGADVWLKTEEALGSELRRQEQSGGLHERRSRAERLHLSSSVSSSSPVAFSGMASRLRLLLDSQPEEPPAGPPLLRLQVSAA